MSLRPGDMPQSPGGQLSEKPLPAVPEDERAWEIRTRYDKFRILIIGRANAGKTTILQRTCNTTDAPLIYDTEGYEVR
jgi:predicted GTPase